MKRDLELVKNKFMLNIKAPEPVTLKSFEVRAFHPHKNLYESYDRLNGKDNYKINFSSTCSVITAKLEDSETHMATEPDESLQSVFCDRTH